MTQLSLEVSLQLNEKEQFIIESKGASDSSSSKGEFHLMNNADS